MRLLPLLFLVAACDTDDVTKDGDGPDWETDDTDGPISTCADDAAVTLSLPAGELVGAVPVTVTLTHVDGEPADLSLLVSAGGAFKPMTVTTGTLTGVPSSAPGTASTFTWDTEADLGEGRFEAVTVQAVARSASCNPWPLAEATVVVDNPITPPPMCAVVQDFIASPVDGPVTVRFTLSRSELATADVQLRYSADGVDFAPATLRAVDCDFDGVTDVATGIAVDEDGVDRCLVWDSERDARFDGDVWLQVGCFVEGTEESAQTQGPVTVANDPSPDPGEVQITEVMGRSRFADGQYVEVRNITRHTLDLQGTTLDLWFEETPLTDPPDLRATLEVPAGALLVDPGDQLLLAAGDDPATNGCLTPDWVWPSAFFLDDDTIVGLSAAAGPLAVLSLLADDGWTFERGKALSLSPAFVGAAVWFDRASWCTATSAIPACPALASTLSFGTPGLANDTCP